jgi:hypothetical protein
MLGMLCKMRTLNLWSYVSQTLASAVMSFMSSAESPQYPASGPVFFAIGTDLGKLLTFSQSVFSMVNGRLFCTSLIGKEFGADAVASVDSIEKGPGMGHKCDTESVDVDKHESVMS